MDRTNQALNGLRETNMKANQEAVAELTYLIKFGSGELEGAFRDTLVQEASPVEPLRYITKRALCGLVFSVLKADVTRNAVPEHLRKELLKTSRNQFLHDKYGLPTPA